METRFRGSTTTRQPKPSSSSSDTNGYEVDLDDNHDDDDEWGRGRRRDRRRRGRSWDEPFFPKDFSLIIVLLVVLGSFTFVKYIDHRVPQPLTTADVHSHPNSFIEERARKHLIELTALGPRVVGSFANDVSAVKIIRDALKEIQSTKSSVHSLEFDVSHPSGSWHLDFLDGMTSSYSQIPLIVAKLEAADASTRNSRNSVLVNCHFDTVPGSPGANDNMVSCVCMLESLRVLSRQSEPLRNPLIFLFNGGEENILQGSHAFIAGKVGNTSTQIGHKWSKNIRTFVNLEGAGAGGREILFQTGPGNGWLVRSYARAAPYPYGSAIGEEIFQRGLIPSDTDFRIFRDNGELPGLDMAWIKNGWVYHTVHDRVDAGSHGSIQHMGSNLLAILQDLGSLDFATVSLSDEKMVYYDIFGFYMMVYSETTGIILNVVVSLLALTFAFNDVNGDIYQVIRNIVSAIVAWIFGVMVSVAVGLLLNLFNYTMPYYTYVSLAFVLFGIPALVGQVLAFKFVLKQHEDHCWMGAKSAIALIILSLTFFTRAVFFLTINLGFGILGWYTARRFFKGTVESRATRDSQRRMLFYLLVGELFPLSMSIYFSTILTDVIVPIMGRSGTEANPNLYIAALTALTITLPGMTGLVPIFVILRKNFLRGAAAAYVLVLAGLIFGIGKNPYGEKTPMRLHIADVDRTWFDSDLRSIKKADAGYWFFVMDPNIPKFYEEWSQKIPELSQIQQIDNNDCEDLYCALPYFFPVASKVRKTQWIPKSSGLPGELKRMVKMEILEDGYTSSDTRRIKFKFIGSPHASIILSPGPTYQLTKWSLTPEIPPTNIFWKNRPAYFIYRGRGMKEVPLELTCDFTKNSSFSPSTVEADPSIIDINYSSFFTSGDEMKTRTMKAFVEKFPSYTYTLGWSAVNQIYKIK